MQLDFVYRYSRRARVSVPSTGRSGLQQRNALSALQVAIGFSTLYGSKWVATYNKNDHRRIAQWFQYPLRVEVGCNVRGDAAKKRSVGVSVPSTGRSGLQLSAVLRKSGVSAVSVPSTGRSGLQRGTINGVRRRLSVSVPSTGRSGLQRTCLPLPSRVIPVSVPSTGRSGLQLSNEICSHVRAFQFQYPLRVEVGCNATISAGGVTYTPFQYPLRVEVGCNPLTTHRQRTRTTFQYPLRVEVGCNIRPRRSMK